MDPIPPTRPRVVLIADSDPLVRWSLAHYLGRWFEVHTVGTISEARQRMDEQTPDSLIVGDEFTDGSGRDFVAETAVTHPDLRIVRITANADPGAAGVNGGGIPTLEKPFALADVAAMIDVST